jgi:hypothetical protein
MQTLSALKDIMVKKETNIPKTAQILFTLPIDLLREFGAVCEEDKLSVDEGCEDAFYTWFAVRSTNKAETKRSFPSYPPKRHGKSNSS